MTEPELVRFYQTHRLVTISNVMRMFVSIVAVGCIPPPETGARGNTQLEAIGWKEVKSVACGAGGGAMPNSPMMNAWQAKSQQERREATESIPGSTLFGLIYLHGLDPVEMVNTCGIIGIENLSTGMIYRLEDGIDGYGVSRHASEIAVITRQHVWRVRATVGDRVVVGRESVETTPNTTSTDPARPVRSAP